jgi:hypothetical protein
MEIVTPSYAAATCCPRTAVVAAVVDAGLPLSNVGWLRPTEGRVVAAVHAEANPVADHPVVVDLPQVPPLARSSLGSQPWEELDAVEVGLGSCAA